MIKPCVPSQVAYGHVHTGQLVCAKLPGQYSPQRVPVREACCAIARRMGS